MELDTGAACLYHLGGDSQVTFPRYEATQVHHSVKDLPAQPMQVTGQLNVRVQYGSQLEKLVLIVGRNWLKYLRLDWSKIATVHSVRMKPLNTLMKEHQQLFAEGLGKVEPYRATCKSNGTPRLGFSNLGLSPLPSEMPSGRSWTVSNSRELLKKSHTVSGQHRGVGRGGGAHGAGAPY